MVLSQPKGVVSDEPLLLSWKTFVLFLVFRQIPFGSPIIQDFPFPWICSRKSGKKEKGPANYLETGNDKGQDKAQFVSRHDTRGRLPIADHYKKSNRRGQNSGPYNQNGEKSKRECNIVVKDAMILKVFDFSLFFPPFQTGRAQVPAVEFHIAKRAQKPPAGAARNDCFLFRVVKATCLFIHHQYIARSPLGRLLDQCREGDHLNRCPTGTAGGHAGSVDVFIAEAFPAFGA
jgi:hypothetical protein